MQLKKLIIYILLSIFSVFLFSEENISSKANENIKIYPFIFYDGSQADKTMNLVVTDYCSAMRIYSRAINETFTGDKFWNKTLNVSCRLFMPFLFYSFVHEEGHSSVLTSKEITSYVRLIPSLDGTAYTSMIMAEMQELHDSDYASYNRVHTAGIESQYMLVQKYNELVAFEFDSLENTKYDALVQLINIFGYEIFPLVLSKSIDNGNDIGDLVYSLYNPSAPSGEEYSWETLGDNEKNYLKKIGMKSFINFANPFFYNLKPFDLSAEKDRSILLTGDAGYYLVPFGDCINENVYFKYGKYNFVISASQYSNENNWFPAFGVKLVDYKITDWCSGSFKGYFWLQPENLNFTTENKVAGGAVDAEVRFTIDKIGLQIGALYKTSGYMMGVEQLDDYFKLSCGIIAKY